MGHHIAFGQNGQAMAAYAGKAAWHELGVVVEGAMTAEEAMTLAGLNWLVEKHQLSFENELVPAWGIFRIGDEGEKIFLGAVEARYTPKQNSELFAFADSLADIGSAQWSSAGALFNGERIFGSLIIPSLGWETATSDQHQMYLSLYSSHDGSLKTTIGVTDFRVVCYNTATAFLNSKDAAKFTMRHTKNADKKMEAAKLEMEVLKKTATGYKEAMELLLSKRIPRTSVKDLVMTILGKEAKIKENGEKEKMTRTENIIDLILANYDADSDNEGFSEHNGSPYALYQAITRYSGQQKGVRKASGSAYSEDQLRAASDMLGAGNKLKTDALEVLVEYASKSTETNHAYTRLASRFSLSAQASDYGEAPQKSLLDSILDA